MEIRLEQSPRLTQSLALTPALIQAIQVLGLTRAELDAHIARAEEENPVLEVDWPEFLRKRDDDMAVCRSAAHGSLSMRERAPMDAEGVAIGYHEATLKDYLYEQVCATDAVAFVIESLDDNGFMPLSAEEVAQGASVTLAEAQDAIDCVRGLDPPGVGAPDHRGALAIQLSRMGAPDPALLAIIDGHLPDIAAGRMAKVARALGIGTDEVRLHVETIRGLNPKPGRGFAGQERVRYVVPDIHAKLDGDAIDITQDRRAAPTLSVSPYYREVMEGAGKDSDEYRFLSDRLDRAVALIKSVEQRSRTIDRIARAVLERQRGFFEEGRKGIVPLTLREIAEETGFHESTVSRAVRGKYVQTPRGVVELRSFFSSGVDSDGGERLSSARIKTRIAELIAGEDAKNPISDDGIAAALKREGAHVARRTVAKYREELGLLSSLARRMGG